MSKKISLNPFSAAILARRLPYALASMLVPGLAIAGPSGGAVVAGQASITPPNGTTTTINQSSQSAIINWQQFNVGSNEYVVFNQPNASAAVLNRVVGGSPSDILGSISANGRVFLINPQGIMFGQGARIDVGGLVASTMDISNQDFMSGRYVFTNGSTGTVSNAGNITAANNGFVVLAGDYVKNTGVIQARLGDVVLASGSAMTLDMTGDGLINFSVDQAALSNRAGVDNLGTLAAQGGTVIMTAKVAHTLTNTAVNNSGQISARGITEDGGDIYLTADGGDVINSGAIDVSGQNSHNAGSVRINSDHDITLAAGSTIIATGADGGDVRVVAENDLSVEHGAHTTVARQSDTGKGGFAEYSGHNSVMIRDIVDLGAYGNLLVDPTNITIGYGGATSGYDQATLESQLRNNPTSSVTTVDATSTDTGTDVGNIHVLGNLQGNTLNGQGFSSGYGGSLVMQAGPGGSITFDDQATTFQVSGDIIIHGGSTGGTQTLGNLDSGHSITIDGYGSINTGYLHAATGVDVTSNNGGVTFTNIDVTNSNNGSGPVAFSDIDVNVAAYGGKISGGYIYVDNHYDPSTGAYGNGTAATLELTASSDIVISGSNGNNQTAINVIGGGGRGTGNSISTAASATLTAGGDIRINNASNATGAIVISGYDYHYPDVNSDSGYGEDIHSGGADLTLEGNTVTIGQTIQAHGEGLVNIDIAGHNGITVAKLDATATAATMDDFEPLADTHQEYGYAIVSLVADQGNSNAIPTTSAIKTGNIVAQGPNAIITAVGGTVELGDTANTSDVYGVTADANTIRGNVNVTDHNNGDSVLYSSNAGSALVSIVAGGHDAQGRGVVTHGGVTLDGPSSQLNLLSAGDVSIGGSLLVTGEGANYSGDASQGSYIRSPLGSIGFFNGDTPFDPSGGTMTWGGAQLLIAGAPGSTSNLGNNAYAGHVGIDGDLTVRGVGLAKAAVSASNLDVGDVSIGATAGSMSGTFTSQETINGNNYTVTHQVGSTLFTGEGVFVGGTAMYGFADFELNLNASTGTTTIASLDVRGDNGSGSASINGGNNVAISGSVNVGQTANTNAPSYAEIVSYAAAPTQPTLAVVTTASAPAIAGHSVGITGDSNVFSVGFDTALTGTFTSGDITVNGTGLTGLAVKANAIQINGAVMVNGYQGSIAFFDANAFETDTPFNDTVFVLNATGGTANVAGAIDVTGAGNLHAGGKMNAGNHTVQLTAQDGSIDGAIPGDLIAFNHPLSGGQFPLVSESAVSLPVLDITGKDIYLSFNADSSLTGLKLNGSGLVSVDGNAGIDRATASHLLNVGASPSLTSGTGDLTVANVDMQGTGTATLTSTGGNITVQNSSFSGSTAALNLTANAHGDLTMNGGHTGPVVPATLLVGGNNGAVLITSTIPAGNVSLTAGGDITARTNIKATRLIMNAGGTLYLGGTSATAGDTSLNGRLGVIDDSSSNALSGFMLTANSLGVTSSQGYIDFTDSTLTVGNGLAKDVNSVLLGKDTAMTSHLDVFAPVSTSPNAAFVATGTSTNPQSQNGQVILGNLTMSGDYLYVKAGLAGFGSLAHTGTGPLFYNFVPRAPGTGVDASGVADLINHFNGIGTNAILARSGSLTNTANLTVAFGSSSQTGQIVAGPLNVSGTNTNLVYVTTGTITGPGAVHTGGHVVLLQGGVLTVDGVVQGQTNQPPPNIDPATAEKALDASGAAADVAAGGNPNGQGSPGDNNGDPLTGQQDPIESHTNDGITATSCI